MKTTFRFFHFILESCGAGGRMVLEKRAPVGARCGHQIIALSAVPRGASLAFRILSAEPSIVK